MTSAVSLDEMMLSQQLFSMDIQAHPHKKKKEASKLTGTEPELSLVSLTE